MIRRLTLLALLSLSMATLAAVGYAGRRTATFTTSCTIRHPNLLEGAQLAGLSVKYATPTNVTLYVSTVRGTATNLVYKVDVVASDSVVILSSGLWFEKPDLLILSNSIPVSTTANADYTYN